MTSTLQKKKMYSDLCLSKCEDFIRLCFLIHMVINEMYWNSLVNLPTFLYRSIVDIVQRLEARINQSKTLYKSQKLKQ